MRFLLLLLLAGCGSECRRYAATMCQKSIACDSPAGAAKQTQAACEQGMNQQIAAVPMNEAQCSRALAPLVPLDCAGVRAVLSP